MSNGREKKIRRKMRSKVNRQNKIIMKTALIKGDNHINKKFYNFTSDQLKIFKHITSERKKLYSNIIKICLKETGLFASLDNDNRIPLDFYDIQHLITYTQLGNLCIGNLPSWIEIKRLWKIRCSVFIVIEGIGTKELSNSWTNSPVFSVYKTKVNFSSPLEYGGSVLEELATIPLTSNQKNILTIKFGSLKNAYSTTGKGYPVFKQIFNITETAEELHAKDTFDSNETDHTISLYKNDKFSRTKLVMTPWEMIQENYPVPINGAKFEGFKCSKDQYKPVTDKSPMFGLDCEMCRTCKGNELTRISIVNEKHEIVYERLVQPRTKIYDYLTEFSGITPAMLKNVTTRLEDVQCELQRILPSDVILVGQSLNFDLKALKLMHPYIIDTSCIFNLSGNKSRKTKLRVLCEEFLSERIQCGGEVGHDSIEDSLAALKLVQAKLNNYLEWGNSILEGKRNQEESKAAKLLLEQRDLLPKVPIVNKYAQNSIHDDLRTVWKSIEYSDIQKKVRKKDNEMLMAYNENSNQDVLFYGASLLQNLVSNKNHRACVIGKSVTIQDYITFVPDCVNLGSESCNLRLLSESKNKRVIKRVCQEVSAVTSRELILAHIILEKDSKKSSVERVEKWMSKIRRACKDDTLLSLIFVGDGQDSKGVCALDIISSESSKLQPIESVVEEIKKGKFNDLLAQQV